MSTRPQLPGDPSDLYLRISYDDDLCDTPQADTLERWRVAVLHHQRVHQTGEGTAFTGNCFTADCPSCTVEDTTVGSMRFFRVHLDRGRNAPMKRLSWMSKDSKFCLLTMKIVECEPLTWGD
ncbi:hypothetical protein [Streptomyces anulatus]|uniref:hypothetical protein n=1 Tax=Streptomyces anulatus TaxID=1892 RepID=UPI003686F3BF